MTNDDDLVRRGDVRAALLEERGAHPRWGFGDEYMQGRYNGSQACIDALDQVDAVSPRPMAEAPRYAIRYAMQDLLTSPAGVVPPSAERFYDAKLGRFSSPLVRQHFLPHPDAPEATHGS